MADSIITDSSRDCLRASNFFTGALAAYTTPGKKLGKVISNKDKDGFVWRFPVPQWLKDHSDTLLLVSHPKYLVEIDGRYRVVHIPDINDIKFVYGFPRLNGYYLVEDLTQRIPSFKARDASLGMRELRRLEKNIGPIVRTCGDVCYGKHIVYLNVDPSHSNTFDVVAGST